MKLASKKSTDKKMNFTTINKTELLQVKGGGKNVHDSDSEEGID